jgi:hypothetical protein
VELIVGTLVIVAVLLVLAAVRVSRMASWRAVAQIAVATGSLKACVDFIRFCERLS